MKLFSTQYLNSITFRGTGKKSNENTNYDLNDVLFYQIIFLVQEPNSKILRFSLL